MSLNSILLILFVSIMATSIAHGQEQNVAGIVNVNGTLYCSANGRSGINPTPVFPNALMEVVCAEGVMVDNYRANATTNATGFYNIYVFAQRGSTVGSIISNCRVFVRTPLSSCNPALPSSGLVSNLQFVRTVQILFLTLTNMIPANFTVQA